jgi:hypothetical protein
MTLPNNLLMAEISLVVNLLPAIFLRFQQEMGQKYLGDMN